jgi:hypothetical protein
MAYVIEHSRADTMATYAVQFTLANYHDRETGTVGPVGLSRLAKECRCARSTVQEAIVRLVELGEVVIIDQGGQGRGRSKTYCFPRFDKRPLTGLLGRPESVWLADDPQVPQAVDEIDPQAEKRPESVGKGTGSRSSRIRNNQDPSTPTRARARANGDDPQPQSTAPYRHDPAPRPGHDPAACALCADPSGKPAPAEARRGWREAVGARPNDWPDGPAEPPPLDSEAERERQKTVLAELIEKGGERP